MPPCGSRGSRTLRAGPRCSRSPRPSSTHRFERRSPTSTVSPEVPFVLSVGGTLIRGSIDLLAVRPDRLGAGRRLQDRPSRSPRPGGDRHPVLDPARPLRAGRGRPRRPGRRPPTCSSSGPTNRCVTSFDRGRSSRRHGLGWSPSCERLAAGRFEVTRPARTGPSAPTARRGSGSAATDTAAQMRDDPDPPIEPGRDEDPADSASLSSACWRA